jgi:hypothetical protein
MCVPSLGVRLLLIKEFEIQLLEANLFGVGSATVVLYNSLMS